MEQTNGQVRGQDQPQGQDQGKGRSVSRRAFLSAGAAGAAGVAGAYAVPVYALADEDPDKERVQTELPIPETAAPDTTDYTCDVLVIGGGSAGLNAAAAAADAGASVVLIDKGRPGYSGLSAWPQSHAYVDPEYDDVEAIRESYRRSGDWLANWNSIDTWISESKQTYERLRDWGILQRYDRASDMGYWEDDDYLGYHDAVIGQDRHIAFMTVLADKGVTVVTQTMVTNVIVQDGVVAGAMGFHVPSGAIVTCRAKSVVMCMGQGAFKPQGWPVSSDTFDGEYILYNLGLPIVNKEFEDFHNTSSVHPGNVFMANSWSWLENIWPCSVGNIDPDNPNNYGASQGFHATAAAYYNEGGELASYGRGGITSGGFEENTNGDPRVGKHTDDTYGGGNVPGSSVGFCGHLMPGVFCGWDDDCGDTGIPGLYVAGDGMRACPPNGVCYGGTNGLTSNICSIYGNHSGTAAAAYASGAELVAIPDQVIADTTAEILAPMNRDKGFDATWAVNELAAAMSPYFVTYAKSDAMLQAALTFVEHLRDEVVPKLMCGNSHDLRLCHEAAHKVLSAEMKLRASLQRKESRGFCYHVDYPYRDDSQFLCYIACVKQDDGTMGHERFEVPTEWQGDLTEDYATRYTFFFPGEGEALGRDDLVPTTADKK